MHAHVAVAGFEMPSTVYLIDFMKPGPETKQVSTCAFVALIWYVKTIPVFQSLHAHVAVFGFSQMPSTVYLLDIMKPGPEIKQVSTCFSVAVSAVLGQLYLDTTGGYA